MKNILLFIILITCVFFLSYPITHALFSDTATSSNNIFTASDNFPEYIGTGTPMPTITLTLTPTLTLTLTPTVTLTPIPSESAQEVVIINEFVANPETIFSKEQVELYNPGPIPVDLTGWTLEDDNNHSKSISSLGVIPVRGFKVYEHSEGWLNNDGDTIYLKNPVNQIVDFHSYTGNIGKDVSIGRAADNSSVWVICKTQTIGSSNNGFCYE